MKSALERVRKIEQRWKVARWALLVAGGALVSFAVWVYRVVLPDGEKLLRLTASEQARLHIQGSEWLVPWLGSKYAFLASRAYVLEVLGVILILWALTQWRGNPTRRAVLELEEEQHSRETTKRDAT